MTDIVCEFRRTIFSERGDIRCFAAGISVGEIVAQFDRPAEFEHFGAVILYRPEEHGLDEHGLPNGQWLAREHWHLVRPKPGTALFVSVVPQNGGGGGGGSNNVMAIVGAIALIALTAWIGGGGLAFLSPNLGYFAAGSTSAKIAAAAVGIAGATALGALTKPPAGALAQSPIAGAGTTLGQAGITQNQIAPYQQLPAVLGTFRVSPPFLALPWTTTENTEQIVHGIVGIPGRYDVSDIRVDTTPVADLPSGIFEYEVRNGTSSDTALTLVTSCGFEQTPHAELSTHRVDTDSMTLLAPASASYPKELIVRTSRRCDKFRLTLQLPSGASSQANSTVLMAFRLRLRRVGDSTWVNLPEAHLELNIRSPLRQEIWFQFGGAESDILDTIAGQNTFWKRLYYKNAEWTANSYFSGGDTSSISANVVHAYAGQSGIYFYLDDATFPVDQYDIGITKGCIDDAGSNFSGTFYQGGLFTYRTFTTPNYTIPDQSKYFATVLLENYTSFRDDYPVTRPGMAMIAFKAHNLQINSLSALFSAYSGTGATTNSPADALSYILTGDLNARALDASSLESLTTWKSDCASNNLECNALVTQGSVEQAAAMAAMCGEALLRRSDKWGVVQDKDRSAESVVAMFHPGNMTKALTVQKTFLAGAANGIIPSIHDAEQDYAVSDVSPPVYDDGVELPPQRLTEGATYDGITSQSQARRRALRDLRAARLRSVKYVCGVHQSQLNIKKGSLCGLAHDVLIDTYAAGRVKGFTKSAGKLLTVTLNTEALDLPPTSWGSNFLDVTNVLQVGNVLTLAGPTLSLQVENADATVSTFTGVTVSGAVVTLSGTDDVPSGLAKTCMASIGPAERVTRRVILADISPEDDFHATLTFVDEAPGIYQGLIAA